MENKQENTVEIHEEAATVISSAGSFKETDTKFKIAGSTTISGGYIEKILKVSGAGKIDGDLRCNGLKSSGSLRGVGNISSQGFVKSSGSFATEGSLQGNESAKFSGSARIGQNATILGSIKSSGSLSISGDLDLGNNARFLGAAKVGGEASIQGFTKSSGSFKTDSNLQAVSGLKSLGYLGVGGNLLSQNNISILGGTKVNGNLVAENIETDPVRWYNFIWLWRFFSRKRPYKIGGNVFAKNGVNLGRTIVDGEVKGYNVKIGRRSEVGGQIYFVNSVKIRRSAKISSEPIQIKPDELKL